ncbi:MAG: glycosyltransferase family 1 protein [Patescibacteria group bacterium]
MKIGIDIRCLMEERYSGISEYTYNLLNHLFKIDPKNQYFLFYNSNKKSKLPEFNFANVIFKGFKYPNKFFNLALRFLKIAEIDKMLGGVDVFLIPNFLFLNLSANCKKVLIIHDLSFELYPEFFTYKTRLWHQLIGPKQLCQQADKIIAISENTKNDIIKIYNIAPEKIKVIYPGIKEIFFQLITEAEKNRVKNKFNLNSEYIFYLGNLEPRKNVETLMLAFEKLNNPALQLVIAGSRAWKYKRIYRLWQKSKLKNQIKFLGYVDAEDKPALYSLAKIFVYPSIYEGFGLPPLEAMACGTPVITSFNSSLVEAVADAGLMTDPNNFNELTEIISRLLADSDLQNLLKQRGRDQSKNFKWQNTAKEILNIIESKN